METGQLQLQNGIEINADEREFEVLIRNVASGKLQKASIAEFLRKNTI
jgi:prophage maintenance system killer protein